MYSHAFERRLTVALLSLAAVVAALALARPAAARCPEGGCGGGPPPPDPRTLTITISGTGTVSDGTTQVCTAATSPCERVYDEGDPVSLSATPGTRWQFTSWTGACTGSPCTFSMSTNKSVTATFTHTTPAAPTITSPAVNAPPPNGSAQSISFTLGSGATKARCNIDSSTLPGPTHSCTSPWSTGALSTGTHTVYIWGLDDDDYASSYTSRSFKIVNRPDTTVGGTPAEGAVVNTLTTAFSFSSSIGGSTFSCTLDGSPIPCNADLSSYLSDGAHTLTAAAGISPLGDGNTYNDTSPAVRHWTIDTQAPDTAISGGPTGSTTTTSADFGFAGTDPAPGTGLHYLCRLDGGPWNACSSGQQYPALGAGAHTFDVKAIDAAGNEDPSPASRTWTVLVDADGDGFFSNTDCNDSNPAIHPGAVDAPGDGIDQDCSGGDTPRPAGGGGGGGAQGVLGSGPSSSSSVLAAKLSRSFKVKGKRTTVRKLVLTRVPAGAKVKLRCKGKGCPFKSKTFRPKHGKLSLTKLFRHRKLANKARLTITLTMPGAKKQVFTISMRSGRKPKLKTA